MSRAASIGRAPSLAETAPYPRELASALGETEGVPFGPYLVYEELGAGGMAYVHRAEHVGENGLRKPVALKRLQTICAEDPDFVAAFVHEAQLAAKLRHPNIAQAYDLGKIDGTYYIAMELVPGPTLAQVMTQAHQGAGAIPLPIALEILIQLCDALDHAHDLRDDGGRPLDLVHRDVSPMNVIISRSGAIKLIDFGIAKARSSRRDTETGIIKGKHAYIAPEYTYGQLDRRADLFGLGVVAHELLTGRRLFAGETEFDTIRNVRSLPIPPPSRYSPDVSTELDAIVLKALEREPDQRWQTAGDMRTALVAEQRRLGVKVTGRQIRDWAEWAFQQTPRSGSDVERMLAGFGPSKQMSVSIEIECPPARPSESELPTLTAEPATTELPTAIAESVTAEIPTVEVIKLETPIPTKPALTPVARAATLPATFTRAATVPATAPRPQTASHLIAKPVAASAPRAPAPALVPSVPRVRRAPKWRAPTRWAKPVKRRSPVSYFIFLALAATAWMLVYEGVIDIEAWREIFAQYIDV